MNLYLLSRLVQDKVSKLTESATRQGKLTSQLKYALSRVTTQDELEVLAAPLKPGSKQSLAAKAVKAGLEQSALDLVNGAHVSVRHCRFFFSV